MVPKSVFGAGFSESQNIRPSNTSHPPGQHGVSQAINSGADEKEAKKQEDRERKEALCNELKALFAAMDEDGRGERSRSQLLFQ